MYTDMCVEYVCTPLDDNGEELCPWLKPNRHLQLERSGCLPHREGEVGHLPYNYVCLDKSSIYVGKCVIYIGTVSKINCVHRIRKPFGCFSQHRTSYKKQCLSGSCTELNIHRLFTNLYLAQSIIKC